MSVDHLSPDDRAPGVYCAECGMWVRTVDAYHPYAACLMFNQCHSEETVIKNLHAVINHGQELARARAAVPPTGALTEAEILLAAWAGLLPPNGELYHKHVELARDYFERREHPQIGLSAEPKEHQPMKMLFTNEQLREQIKSDPDVDDNCGRPSVETGGSHGS